mmetsp:Transcript_32780/g.102155  ORF Transcript_32780/g.102155 Transcript_32780/m.102155 type:complete len:222 (+) Transcript_32780:633-1298(+)
MRRRASALAASGWIRTPRRASARPHALHASPRAPAWPSCRLHQEELPEASTASAASCWSGSFLANVWRWPAGMQPLAVPGLCSRRALLTTPSARRSPARAARRPTASSPCATSAKPCRSSGSPTGTRPRAAARCAPARDRELAASRLGRPLQLFRTLHRPRPASSDGCGAPALALEMLPAVQMSFSYRAFCHSEAVAARLRTRTRIRRLRHRCSHGRSPGQ